MAFSRKKTKKKLLKIQKEYCLSLKSLSDISDVDCIILTVAQEEFKDLTLKQIDTMNKNVPNQEKDLINVKSILDKKALENIGKPIGNFNYNIEEQL